MDYFENNNLDYELDDLKILSDSFFDIDDNNSNSTEVNIYLKKEIENMFTAEETKKLSDAAKKIRNSFETNIIDTDSIKNEFINLRDNYTDILKILNGKVKKFEVSNGEYKKLKSGDKAIIDQALKIKQASIFFEHANINFEQAFDQNLKSLEDLIINKEIDFKIDKINVKNNNSQKGEGNINEVLFTDDKKWVIKKDKFFITKGKSGAVHRQNKETGVYGHFAKDGKQFVADSVSRQMGQQDIAQALGLDCIVKTKAALLKDEDGKDQIVTVMENASLKEQDDLEVHQGAEVLLCTSQKELNQANDFLEKEKLKKLKPEVGKLKDYYYPKLVTPKILNDILAIGAMDFISGQVDRHSGNLFMHFKKNGDVKFKLIDNDRCFVISFSYYDYREWLEQKIPVVTTSLALRIMMFAKDYKEKTEKKLAGHIGKAGGSKDTFLKKPKALLETEKRIIMLYNYTYKTNFLEIDEICNDAKQKYQQVNNIYKEKISDKDFSLDFLNSDVGKWQNNFKLDINSYKNNQRLNEFFKKLNQDVYKSNKKIINDCDIEKNLEGYANKFLNVTPKFSLLLPLLNF